MLKVRNKKIVTYDKGNISKFFLSPYVEILIFDERRIKLSQLLFGKIIIRCNVSNLLNLLEDLQSGLDYEQFFASSKKIFKTDKNTEEFVSLMIDGIMVE